MTFASRSRVALRLAWRDLSRHKIRTLVGVLLFALPVALVVGFVSSIESYDKHATPSPLTSVDYVYFTHEDQALLSPDVVENEHDHLQELIGSDADSLSPVIHQDAALTNGDRSADVHITTVDDAPDGSGPHIDPGTVLLDDSSMFLLGVEEGDTVSVGGSDLQVIRTTQGGGAIAHADDVPVDSTVQQINWYLPADADDAEPVAASLNEAADNHPDVPLDTDWISENPGGASNIFEDTDPVTILAVALVVILAVLLVSAVISPVFAVAARRQRRAMGLMSATGASPSDLRLVMLAEGLLVGLIGATVGLAASTGVAALLITLTSEGDYAWAWGSAAIVVVVTLVVGVTSALIPAIRAGREDPVQALDDGGSERMTGFRWRMLTGLLFLVPGALISATSSGAFDDDGLYIGISLIGIGLILSSSLLVWLMSRAGRHLPTAGRLAVRDSLRNHHRTIPAVAAVSGATFLAAVMVSLPTDTSEPTSFRDNVALTEVRTEGGQASSYADEMNKVASRLGVRSQHAVSDGSRAEIGGQELTVELPSPDNQSRSASGGAVTGFHTWTDLLVTDGATFEAFKNVPAADIQRASDAMADGKAVVADPAFIEDGKIQFDYYEYNSYYGTPPVTEDNHEDPREAVETQSIPAVSVPTLANAISGVALSPDTGEKLGLTEKYLGEVMILDSPVSIPEAALATTGTWPASSSYVNVETPAVDGEKALMVGIPVVLSWILTLGTVLLVVFLASSESRRDMMTITAVGAPPGLMRRFAATQAVFIALGGTLAGVVFGLIPKAGEAVRGYLGVDFSDGFLSSGQWLAVGLTVVVGPALAWAAGEVIGAVTSRDSNVVRRRD
jgi:putative ABC transport system permease protein